MNEKKSQFTRKYKRASKSPWNDMSTLLLLADIESIQSMNLSFEKYIYCHRDSLGKVLGISLSKAMLDANPDFSGRYLEGVEMYAFLLLYIDDIKSFCSVFEDEFTEFFMLPPAAFFSVAEVQWLALLEAN